jgi:hypothetical protein
MDYERGQGNTSRLRASGDTLGTVAHSKHLMVAVSPADKSTITREDDRSVSRQRQREPMRTVSFLSPSTNGHDLIESRHCRTDGESEWGRPC